MGGGLPGGRFKSVLSNLDVLKHFQTSRFFDGTPGPDRKQPVDLEYLKLRKLGTRNLEITRNHHQDLLLSLWFHGVLKGKL